MSDEANPVAPESAPAEAAAPASEPAPAPAPETPAAPEATPEAPQAAPEAVAPAPEEFRVEDAAQDEDDGPVEEPAPVGEFHETPEDHPSRLAPGLRPAPAGPEQRYHEDENRA